MEKYFKNRVMMTKISLLAAFGAVLMYFELPILPAFAWLKIDFSGVPALIGAFAFGPVVGVIIEALKILVIFFIKGSGTGGIGELANLIMGAAIVIPAGIMYRKNRDRKTAIISLVVGTISMTIAGVLANYFILVPLYSAFMPALKESDYVTTYLITGIVPFNLIKGGLVSLVTVLVYKRVSGLINREATMVSKKKIS
ncbi:ECF transporter S component [Clostridium cellulovorans]|uniref:Riboflavin transporter n=1 Tax=Clostridium cellulovorans (strain ATCC 35296 / DSM 3052 / OCM 3 / 743B) TaxID=573061 RepID=D9STI7_CLOC7|nr:ECF transporter S component [Clostridium cellulovorans]ADL52721.1 hypothetical protein Clocel_3031 [Clostridium cellulovorans 743B]